MLGAKSNATPTAAQLTSLHLDAGDFAPLLRRAFADNASYPQLKTLSLCDLGAQLNDHETAVDSRTELDLLREVGAQVLPNVTCILGSDFSGLSFPDFAGWTPTLTSLCLSVQTCWVNSQSPDGRL